MAFGEDGQLHHVTGKPTIHVLVSATPNAITAYLQRDNVIMAYDEVAEFHRALSDTTGTNSTTGTRSLYLSGYVHNRLKKSTAMPGGSAHRQSVHSSVSGRSTPYHPGRIYLRA